MGGPVDGGRDVVGLVLVELDLFFMNKLKALLVHRRLGC